MTFPSFSLTGVLALVCAGLLLLITGCNPLDPMNGALVNGDFEQSLESGWLTETNGSTATPPIELTDTLGQPDSGHSLRVAQTGSGSTKVWQVVSVDNDYYMLGFTARFRVGGSLSCVPIASVILSYLDAGQNCLGSTRWYLPSPDCDWAASDTCRLVPVGADTWARYQIDLHDELASNLRGVRTADIKFVRIEIRAEAGSGG